MKRERVHGTRQFLGQHAIDELVPLDLAQSFEGSGYGHELEVGVRAWSGMHVAFVQQLEVAGLQGNPDLRFDAGGHVGGVWFHADW